MFSLHLENAGCTCIKRVLRPWNRFSVFFVSPLLYRVRQKNCPHPPSPPKKFHPPKMKWHVESFLREWKFLRGGGQFYCRTLYIQNISFIAYSYFYIAILIIILKVMEYVPQCLLNWQSCGRGMGGYMLLYVLQPMFQSIRYHIFPY